jgi:hypothetical protein
MIRNEHRDEAPLPSTDARLIGFIKSHSDEPPSPSPALRRSLREISSGAARTSKPRSTFAERSLAAGAIAAILAVLLFSLPETQPHTFSNESLFADHGASWNYELFAPPEFDELNMVYQSEFTLPSEYNALEYWVY